MDHSSNAIHETPSIRQIAEGATLTPGRASRLQPEEIDFLSKLISDQRRQEIRTHHLEIVALKASINALNPISIGK